MLLTFTLLKVINKILRNPQPFYQKRCLLKRAFSCVMCVNFGLWRVRETSSHVYSISLYKALYYLTLVLCEFGDAIDSKKRKGHVRKPTETEALPLHVDKSDQIKEVILFDSEYLEKLCEDATLKESMFA